ncbi:MAG: hypothetical protein AABO57_02920 [Acidobacteriota bacterium]
MSLLKLVCRNLSVSSHFGSIKTIRNRRLKFKIELNQETLTWLNNFPDAWFSRDGGNAFLRENGGIWTATFDNVVNHEVRAYFGGLGLSDDYMPFIQHGDTYLGSWVMDAAIVMRGTMGRAYTALSTIGDLSRIAEGVTGLKSRMLQRLSLEINDRVRDTISWLGFFSGVISLAIFIVKNLFA